MELQLSLEVADLQQKILEQTLEIMALRKQLAVLLNHQTAVLSSLGANGASAPADVPAEAT